MASINRVTRNYDADPYYLQVSGMDPFWKKIPPANLNDAPVIEQMPENIDQITAAHTVVSPLYIQHEEVVKHLRINRKKILDRILRPSMYLYKLQTHFAQKAATLGPVFEAGPPWSGQLVAQCKPWIAAQCGVKRKKAAKIYCDHHRYITHEEFKHRLLVLYENIKDILMKKNTYLVIDERNSSEYCAILLQQLLKKDLSEKILYISYDYLGYQLKDFLREVIQLASLHDSVTLLEIDDMTYSAGQAIRNHVMYYTSLYEIIYNTIYKRSNSEQTMDLFITRPSLVKSFMETLGISHHNAFVYATKRGEDILTGRIPFHPYKEEDVIPLFYPLGVTIGEVFDSVREKIGDTSFTDLAAYFGWPSRYGSDDLAPDAIVYFDHKIADKVSVMGMPLLTGRLALTEANLNRINHMNPNIMNGDEDEKRNQMNENNKVNPIIIEPWVRKYVKNGSRRCSTDPVPLLPLCAAGIEEDNPYLYPEERCPPAWYKYFPEKTSQLRLRNSYRKQYPWLPVEGGTRRKQRGLKKTRRKRVHTKH